MPHTPITSLMSSAGSKANDLRHIAGDERSSALRSTWISRLQLNPLPPLPDLPPPLLAPRSPRFFAAKKPEPEKEVFNGFGPFLIRDSKGNSSEGSPGNGPFPLLKRVGNLGGGEKVGSWEERGGELERRGVDGRIGVQLSPFFQVRSVGNAGYAFDGEANDAIRMSRGKGVVESYDHVMPATNGIRSSTLMFPSFSQRELIRACPSQRPYNNASLQLVPRSRGAPYHVDAADHCPSKMVHEPHMVRHSMVPCDTVRQTSTCRNQHEEPFSFWNMGRFRTSSSISSVSPTHISQSNLGRKRNPSTNYFLLSKSRKLGGGN
ncbi:uncharacterized protein [Typha latifolia]|uniref:uncharacterized protein n=1 Tax=Typha latifolia TaxID=4733 RepID=UPI003C2E68ED